MIHSMLYAVRAQTPGERALAQPRPQEVAPCTNHWPPLSQTNGPPLSPWQASVTAPLLRPLAQSISGVKASSNASSQSQSDQTSTAASWSFSGNSPLVDKVPQP